MLNKVQRHSNSVRVMCDTPHCKHDVSSFRARGVVGIFSRAQHPSNKTLGQPLLPVVIVTGDSELRHYKY